MRLGCEAKVLTEEWQVHRLGENSEEALTPPFVLVYEAE